MKKIMFALICWFHLNTVWAQQGFLPYTDSYSDEYRSMMDTLLAKYPNAKVKHLKADDLSLGITEKIANGKTTPVQFCIVADANVKTKETLLSQASWANFRVLFANQNTKKTYKRLADIQNNNVIRSLIKRLLKLAQKGKVQVHDDSEDRMLLATNEVENLLKTYRSGYFLSIEEQLDFATPTQDFYTIQTQQVSVAVPAAYSKTGFDTTIFTIDFDSLINKVATRRQRRTFEQRQFVLLPFRCL